MKAIKTLGALASVVAVLAASPANAGDSKTFKEPVVVEQPTQWYNATLSTGWDSLYMYRGLNTLRKAYGNTDNYGSGIYWADLAFTWNITPTDLLTLETWAGFGTQNTSYKEQDVLLYYTKNIGKAFVGAGYELYFIYPTGSQFYANELSVKAGYNFDLGFMTLTPSAVYYFNLGPDISTGHGAVKTASSYLNLRLDGSIPLYKDIISLAPWGEFGLNFMYNSKLTSSGSLAYFNGANNIDFGVALPIKLNKVITVSGYVAYSYAFYNLGGTTQPSTFWGGAKVAFSF